ncbi:hypothetical protein PIB30_050930 [Stylosanthes scabra]|uniref:Uncharacterized protein n=1 Tax=Stylosanthes scabra TaxID=79078 RepID=A0ABU6RHY1_9FABA|nr:hypothetical protein [Stylosanthes scabra]
MFVKVRSPEDEFPFYLDECLLERFPLYWYAEPVRILGMDEVDEGSAVVIDFLDQYLCSKEPLSLNRGVVVNQPAEKKRPISVKRRRAEDGTSDKGKVIDLTNSKCCGKEVSLDEVKTFTANQKKLHGYVGAENLSSVWSEHFQLPVVVEKHFQSKAGFHLIESVSDIRRAQFMQVYAARMLCIGRYEEVKARKEAEQKRNEGAELQKSVEREKELKLALEQVSVKEKELLGVKAENEGLKEKVQKLEKDKEELEARVVELCGLKKEAEVSKEDHGYEMLLAGFARAKRQVEFFFPEVQFDKLDPIKVVHNGALVDDDEVDLEGGDNHDPEA